MLNAGPREPSSREQGRHLKGREQEETTQGKALLRHPVHFVCPASAQWPEITTWTGQPLTDPEMEKRCRGAFDTFVTRPYYELRLLGAHVTISPDLRPGCINMAGVREFGRRDRRLNAFVVINRADSHYPCLADFVTRQTIHPGVDEDLPTTRIWIQPGLKPRSPERRDTITTLTFKGLAVNLHADFRSEAFFQALREIDVRCDFEPLQGQQEYTDWSDYRESDLVLAIRNMTQYDAQFKPDSKLVNAWWAEVPALLGPEPAYRNLRQSPLDFIEIRTPADVIAAIRKLKAEPALYQAMVVNGVQRRAAFTNQAALQSWIDAINGPIAEAFEAWRRRSTLARVAGVLRGMMAEPKSKASHHARALSGPRILDAEA